ncbi:competence protein ComK [Anaerobacillus sp. MEB173]|uniref:competence protein ComK n=1 Tax=Anaerobacillus sp. MEB173 TaxID=3383345 RepID=UPI003F914F04
MIKSVHSIVDIYSRRLYTNKRPLQLIKESCLDGGSTYDGRRTDVTHLTGIHSKVPIPIHPLEEIYCFPTHSATQFECSWLFYRHIKSFDANNPSSQTIITFQDYQQLELDVSPYVIEKQMHRTAFCMLRFGHRTAPSSFYQPSFL